VAGHSKWHNIKHRKAAVDAKRGKAWTKCAKAIMVAAKNGGPDRELNLTLRYAIDEARYANMPRDTIERAIKKGAGLLGTDNYENVRYEGYGPSGVAVVVDALTNNRTRTAGDLRLIFGKFGGNLGTSGCVGFMFESKGRILVDGMQGIEVSSTNPSNRKGADILRPIYLEVFYEIAIAAGALDVIPPDESGLPWTVLTSPTEFHAVRHSLEASGVHIAEASIDMIPTTTITVRGEVAKSMIKLYDSLEENDDVQKVYANFDIPDDEVDVLG